MDIPSDTKRAAYFTEAELEVLMLAYEEFKPIIMRRSNTAASAKERELAWQKITDRVNACKPSGARRTLSQVKMKHKNILQKANRKNAEARRTGGGPPPPPLTPSEELALSLNKGRPVVKGIPGGTSSHTTSHDASNLGDLPAKELYKVHLRQQIKRSDLEMDLIQLKIEEKRLAIKKARLEIEMLEHRLKDIKK